MRKMVIGPPVVQWVGEKLEADFGPAVGFGIEKDGKLIAGVVFCAYNKASMFIHVASDETAKWMSKELLLTVFDYAFNQAKVQTLIGPVPESNMAARRFDEHIGFVRSAEIPNAHPDGTLYLYTMTREQCKWINHGKTERTATA